MAKKESRKPRNKKKAKMMMAAPRKAPPLSRTEQYKRLLLDPCNAELCPSPWGDEGGSLITRAHQIVNNPVDTWLLFWHPYLGWFHLNSAPGVPASLTPVTTTGGSSGAETGRALAGCVEAMYMGAESSRAGVVRCTMVPGAIVWNYLSVANGGGGATIDSANVANYFPTAERMPVDRCTLNWFPAGGDSDFTPPLVTNAAQTGAVEKIFSSTHFCAVLVAGAGANTVTFSFTGVVETSSLLATAPASGNKPSVPWNIAPKTSAGVDVPGIIRDLTRRDPGWFVNTFKKVGKLALGFAGTYVNYGLPGALGYLTSELSGGQKISNEVVRSGRG